MARETVAHKLPAYFHHELSLNDDVHRLQEEISYLTSSEMEPILRPHVLVDEVDGETVMVAEIDEIPVVQKPCFYQPHGLPQGAYLHVGNINRQMTAYEVFAYLSSRGQPAIDEEVIPNATIETLASVLLDEYLARLRQARPTSAGFLMVAGQELRGLLQAGLIA